MSVACASWMCEAFMHFVTVICIESEYRIEFKKQRNRPRCSTWSRTRGSTSQDDVQTGENNNNKTVHREVKNCGRFLLLKRCSCCWVCIIFCSFRFHPPGGRCYWSYFLLFLHLAYVSCQLSNPDMLSCWDLTFMIMIEITLHGWKCWGPFIDNLYNCVTAFKLLNDKTTIKKHINVDQLKNQERHQTLPHKIQNWHLGYQIFHIPWCACSVKKGFHLKSVLEGREGDLRVKNHNWSRYESGQRPSGCLLPLPLEDPF